MMGLADIFIDLLYYNRHSLLTRYPVGIYTCNGVEANLKKLCIYYPAFSQLQSVGL